MIGIINSNIGNIASIFNAIKSLDIDVKIVQDHVQLEKMDKVILPGVGSAPAGMAELQKRGLDEWLRNTTKPVLGICLGMQLLAEFSEEGSVPCLGIIPISVKRFQGDLKVPHMGWNRVNYELPITNYQLQNSYFYFIHSYYLPLTPWTIATCDYGIPFSAIIQKDNFMGVQFHPEKSGEAGMGVLRRFAMSDYKP